MIHNMTLYVGFLIMLLSPRIELRLPCDMKSVSNGYYCEADDLVLGARDLVSNAHHYACGNCDSTSKDRGTCATCDEPLVVRISQKNVCPECFFEPVKCRVCVKVFFECENCGRRSTKPGECMKCARKMTTQVSRSLIYYLCNDCGMMQLRAGKCVEEACERFGKSLSRSCALAGEFPHLVKR